MDKAKLLKNIFELAENGIYTNVNELPEGISKDVVYKNLLYIELKNIVKSNGSRARIEEIKLILNPPQEEEIDG